MKTTYKEALDTYMGLVEQFQNGEALNPEAVKALSYAVNNDLQIRDLLLGGLPTTFTAIGAVAFITEVLPLIEQSERTPFYTLMSTYYLEAGDRELAYASLITGKALNPDYPLADLIEQVIKSGQDGGMFEVMREQLHPAVVKHVTENLEFVIA